MLLRKRVFLQAHENNSKEEEFRNLQKIVLENKRKKKQTG